MPADNKYDTTQYFLLKAESLCAELMANGVGFDDLIVQHSGSFRKSYRNDIESVSTLNGNKSPVCIVVNRDGIYDKLPEGLFHQTRGGSNTAALSAMVSEYRRFREEEKQARKFFQPLEQELFRYAVGVEEEERKLEFSVLQGNPDTAFYHFWNIDKFLPEKPAATLVLMMPWLKQIKGDRKLTAKALSMILGKKVTVRLDIVEEQRGGKDHFILGAKAALGRDTVCGNHFAESYEQWLFSIEEIHADELAYYTPENGYGRLLKRFEELFIPLDVAVKFEYQHLPESDPVGYDQILGYGYYL